MAVTDVFLFSLEAVAGATTVVFLTACGFCGREEDDMGGDITLSKAFPCLNRVIYPMELPKMIRISNSKIRTFVLKERFGLLEDGAA